jgi:hypothetical protein
MEARIKKFLEFNGQIIFFVAIDGIYWIAIRPICDALNVEYTRAFKNIKEDKILRDVLAKQPMRDTKNRLQNMVALPEKYIYGWLFSIRSGSDAFQNYKRKCYDVLYEYFHGGITSWHQALLEKSDALSEMEEKELNLSTNPDFIAWNEARAKVMRVGKRIKEISDDFIHGQLSIDFKQSN